MHFYFHTLSLTSSGGSRVITNLSNYLSDNGHTVTIMLDRNRIAFPLNDNIKVFQLSSFSIKDITPKIAGDTTHFQKHLTAKSKRKTTQRIKLRDKYTFIHSINEWKKYLLKLTTFPSKLLLMKAFINKHQPDAFVSHNMYYFLEHYFFYPKAKRFVVLHNSPKEIIINRGIKHLLPLSFYFQNLKCLSVSDGVLDEMKELMPCISSDSQTIYNPFDFNEIRIKSDASLPEFFQNNRYLISVSSLAPGKRIERIVNSFNQLSDKSLHLVIMGVGEEEEKLKTLINKLNISERVVFTGFIENPLPYMKNAEALLLTSDSEGLPTVLIEALVCNTPVISTNCYNGPKEILTGSLKPYLVEIENREEADIIDDISAAIDLLLSSKYQVNESDILKFEKNKIIKDWESIIY